MTIPMNLVRAGVPMPILSALTSEWMFYGMVTATVALCVAAVVAPRRVPRARESAELARVSPLWLLVPLAVAAYLVLFTPPTGSESFVVALFVLQLAGSVWIVYRHRRWLWVALPLAVVLGLWPVMGMVALAMGSMAH